jgi:hypothetical protein
MARLGHAYVEGEINEGRLQDVLLAGFGRAADLSG